MGVSPVTPCVKMAESGSFRDDDLAGGALTAGAFAVAVGFGAGAGCTGALADGEGAATGLGGSVAAFDNGGGCSTFDTVGPTGVRATGSGGGCTFGTPGTALGTTAGRLFAAGRPTAVVLTSDTAGG